MSEITENKPSQQPLIPMVLIAHALFLIVAFQTVQLVRDSGTLKDVRIGQEAMVQDSLKLCQQLETLAGSAAILAQDGNTAARAVVENMKRQGITLTPPAKQ